MGRTAVIPVWRVMVLDPARRVWTVRSSHDDELDADDHAQAHRYQGARARVVKGTRKVLSVKPPVYCETREWREAEAQRLMDLADASKRYKSPG